MRASPIAVLSIALCVTGVVRDVAQQSVPAASAPNGTQAVLVPVVVTDGNGRHVPNLDRAAFLMQEKRTPLTVTDVLADGPLTVALVVDTSASMNRDDLIRAGEALHRILDALAPDSEVMVISATTRGAASSWQQDRRAVADALDRLGQQGPKGATALHSAMIRSLLGVGTGRFARRAVIVVSDGQDTISGVPSDAVIDALRQTPALVYALMPRPDRPNGESRWFMKRVEVTGGRVFDLGGAKDSWTKAADAIAADLQHYYLVSIVPSRPPDRRWHQLTVAVSGRGRLTVRSRTGYSF